MNIRRLWLKLAVLFSLTVLITAAVPVALAYIVVQSETVVNTFIAPYFPPEGTAVDVGVHKVVHSVGAESIGPEGFQFALQDAESGESWTMTADANGDAAVTLSYSDEDVGKAYMYRLYEVDDGRENVTYSNVVYIIRIELSVNAENKMVAAASVNGTPVERIIAEFENGYTAGVILPETGDDSNLLLYAVLALLSCVGLVMLARRNGWVMK